MTTSELTRCGSKAADFPASPIIVKKSSLWSNWEGWDQSRARRLQTPVLLLQFWPVFKIKCFSMCCLPLISLQGPKIVACWQFCPFFIPDFGGKDLLTFSCVIAGSLTSMAQFFFFMAHVLTLADNSGLQIFSLTFLCSLGLSLLSLPTPTSVLASRKNSRPLTIPWLKAMITTSPS